MGEIRDRMEEDLALRGLARATCTLYLRVARDFVAFHRRSRKDLGTEDARGCSTSTRSSLSPDGARWVLTRRDSIASGTRGVPPREETVRGYANGERGHLVRPPGSPRRPSHAAARLKFRRAD